jgi:hypothetical protein
LSEDTDEAALVSLLSYGKKAKNRIGFAGRIAADAAAG